MNPSDYRRGKKEFSAPDRRTELTRHPPRVAWMVADRGAARSVTLWGERYGKRAWGAAAAADTGWSTQADRRSG
jgi:hypothetical protein